MGCDTTRKMATLLILIMLLAALFGGCGSRARVERATVRVDFADGLPTDYHEFASGGAMPQIKLVFSVDATVRDFKLLALTVSEAGKDGELSFSAKEIFVLIS